MVGPRVLAAQPPGHDLAVVVGEVCEAADARDVAGAIDAIARLERFRVDLEPAALGLGQSRGLPGLEVGAAPGRDEQAVPGDDRS